jgi:hypothetical protein
MRRAAAVALLGIAAAGAAAGWTADAGVGWRRLETGLELGTFAAPRPSRSGDSLIRIVRIDPRHFALRLLNASAPGEGTLLTPGEWARRHDLVAAINASMYQTDYRTSVSLMRTGDHVNNPRLSKDRAVLAFDPLDDGLPPVQIIDRECQDFDSLRGRYTTLVQSIRMISCERGNVWSPQDRSFSTAAIGVDGEGRVLFIHVRSPYATHDLIAMLLELPINLRRAMYTEGGSEAQLYLRAGGEEHQFAGMSDVIGDGEGKARGRPVPNVVGVVRRAAPLSGG